MVHISGMMLIPLICTTDLLTSLVYYQPVRPQWFLVDQHTMLGVNARPDCSELTGNGDKFCDGVI